MVIKFGLCHATRTSRAKCRTLPRPATQPITPTLKVDSMIILLPHSLANTTTDQDEIKQELPSLPDKSPSPFRDAEELIDTGAEPPAKRRKVIPEHKASP